LRRKGGIEILDLRADSIFGKRVFDLARDIPVNIAKPLYDLDQQDEGNYARSRSDGGNYQFAWF
jgi:hypothetical protein